MEPLSRRNDSRRNRSGGMDGGMSPLTPGSRGQPAPEVPFIDTIPEDLQCQICLGASIEPVVTEECGHLFCRECITVALERKKECPVDRQPLTYTELRKDVRTDRKIHALTTACYHKKQGCPWKGAYSDLERHSERCDHATVKCPYAVHGCETITTRRTLQEHITTNMHQHLAFVCGALTKLSEEHVALQQEVELLQRDETRFIWVIPNFEIKRGPVYSRKFTGRGAQWYLGIDFEGPDQHAGVYLFAEGHTKRVDFKLILYNVDHTKDKVHMVNDWANDYKGKGWGPLKFIDRANLTGSGFIVNGCVRIGTEIDSEPFE